MHDQVQSAVACILDSDDILLPEANSILKNEFRSKSCSMVTTQFILCDVNLDQKRQGYAQASSALDDRYEHLRAWRTSCLPKSAFPSHSQDAEDRDLFYKMEEIGPLIFVSTPLVLWRQHANSLTKDVRRFRSIKSAHCEVRLRCLIRRGILKVACMILKD